MPRTLTPSTFTGNSTLKHFIVLPTQSMSFQYWAATLQTDYSSQDVPLPFSENMWQDWAQALKERNVFQNNEIPDPRQFSDWRSWATRLVQVLNA